jgi:two-component system response regulator AtoC
VVQMQGGVPRRSSLVRDRTHECAVNHTASARAPLRPPPILDSSLQVPMSRPTTRIIVCDDEELVRWSLAEHLRSIGYDVLESTNGREALETHAAHPADLLLLDVIMPVQDGLTTLRALRERGDETPVIMLTALGKIETAVEATRLGAARYLTKPFELAEIADAIAQVLHVHWVTGEADSAGAGAPRYAGLVGGSRAMLQLFETLRRLEQVDAPTVLITGESGTGKELVARAIHSQGPRGTAPFVEVDCTAIPEALLESTLFGHEKGAFTDARAQHKGLFETAQRGVVFLDELGELPLPMQAKLLRALEGRTFKRVGGTTNIPFEAAIVAATHRDLRQSVERGLFREDLFYRLNVVPIEVPPLRARSEDVTWLTEHFIAQYNRTLGRNVPGIREDALEALTNYRWPGNIRELRNVIERVLIFKNDDPIGLEDLPANVRFASSPHAESCPFVLPDEGISLEAVEESLVRQAIERTDGHQAAAARLLGLSRFALRNRMKKFGLLA